MAYYQAYGLRIDSDVELPEVLPATAAGEAAADIAIRTRRIDRDDPANDPDSIPNTIGLHYPNIASMLVTAGSRVEIDAVADADPRILRLILLGPVLGLLLHQRGYLVLHASAVEVGGSCVAFIGDKGAGKSTTAAAFNAQGYSLIADDVVAVSPGSHSVYPGFPQLKLWREAAEHLASTEGLPTLHPDLDKLGLRVERRFAQSPRTLSRIYALAEGPAVAIEPITGSAAFMQLVRHSYALPLVRPTGSAQTHFRQAVEVAGKIPVRRLARPRSLAMISQLVAAVVEDAA